MHPEILIVQTYTQSDGLSTGTEISKTLTNQSTDTNNAPRDPIPFPVKIMNFICQYV